MNDKNKEDVMNRVGTSSENTEENYEIPNETSCSAEFPQGCISGD